MKIHQLLDTPEKWIQGAYARSPEGFRVDPRDPYANCWCLYGAIVKCYPDLDERVSVIRRIRQKLHIDSIAIYNDTKSRTYNEIMLLTEELDI